MIEIATGLVINGFFFGAMIYDNHRARWARLLRMEPMGGEQ